MPLAQRVTRFQRQLIEEETGRFELQVVTIDQSYFASLQPLIALKLKDLLGEDAEINIHWRPNIVQRPGQKFRVVVACGK